MGNETIDKVRANMGRYNRCIECDNVSDNAVWVWYNGDGVKMEAKVTTGDDGCFDLSVIDDATAIDRFATCPHCGSLFYYEFVEDDFGHFFESDFKQEGETWKTED